MPSEKVSIVIEVKDNGTVALRKVSQEAERMGTGIKAAAEKATSALQSMIAPLTSIQGMLASLAGAAGVGLLTKSFIDVASSTEQAALRIKVLAGDATTAAAVFKQLTEYAAKTPFTYEEIIDSAVALIGTLERGADEIMDWLPLIGDLAAASGLSIREATGQFIRMYSAGAQAADLFRERGILAMLGFKAGVSYEAEETRRILVEAWESSTSKFRGATDELSVTWKGLWSQIQDTWFQFRQMVMESGPFEQLKAGLSSLVAEVERLKQSGDLKAWAADVGYAILSIMQMALTSVRSVIDAIGWIYKSWLDVKKLFVEGEVEFAKLTQRASEFANVLAKSPAVDWISKLTESLGLGSLVKLLQEGAGWLSGAGAGIPELQKQIAGYEQTKAGFAGWQERTLSNIDTVITKLDTMRQQALKTAEDARSAAERTGYANIKLYDETGKVITEVTQGVARGTQQMSDAAAQQLERLRQQLQNISAEEFAQKIEAMAEQAGAAAEAEIRAILERIRLLMSEEPITIPVNVDISSAQQQIQQLKQEASSGAEMTIDIYGAMSPPKPFGEVMGTITGWLQKLGTNVPYRLFDASDVRPLTSVLSQLNEVRKKHGQAQSSAEQDAEDFNKKVSAKLYLDSFIIPINVDISNALQQIRRLKQETSSSATEMTIDIYGAMSPPRPFGEVMNTITQWMQEMGMNVPYRLFDASDVRALASILPQLSEARKEYERAQFLLRQDIEEFNRWGHWSGVSAGSYPGPYKYLAMYVEKATAQYEQALLQAYATLASNTTPQAGGYAGRGEVAIHLDFGPTTINMPSAGSVSSAALAAADLDAELADRIRRGQSKIKAALTGIL